MPSRGSSGPASGGGSLTVVSTGRKGWAGAAHLPNLGGLEGHGAVPGRLAPGPRVMGAGDGGLEHPGCGLCLGRVPPPPVSSTVAAHCSVQGEGAGGGLGPSPPLVPSRVGQAASPRGDPVCPQRGGSSSLFLSPHVALREDTVGARLAQSCPPKGPRRTFDEEDCGGKPAAQHVRGHGGNLPRGARIPPGTPEAASQMLAGCSPGRGRGRSLLTAAPPPLTGSRWPGLVGSGLEGAETSPGSGGTSGGKPCWGHTTRRWPSHVWSPASGMVDGCHLSGPDALGQRFHTQSGLRERAVLHHPACPPMQGF